VSRKDYEAIAAVERESGDLFRSNSAHAIHAGRLAAMLAEDNARFDRARFIAACMPTWMVGTRHANVWERVARA
jgi:hypothetical protein